MATSAIAMRGGDRAQPEIATTPARRLIAGLGPLLLLYVLYLVVRYVAADRGPNLALENAVSVIDVERRLGIFWEHGLQTASLPHSWLIKAANWYYVFGFLPILIASGVLAALRAPLALAYWRRIFVVSLLLAVAGYTYYPLTPPRLLPNTWGFVDTLTAYGPQYYGDHTGASFFNGFGRMPSLVNVDAAMPSMHVAWSVVASALIVGSFAPRRWLHVAAVLHPVLMAAAVVLTANHYLLDVFAGLIVLGLSLAVVQLLPWRFRPAPSTPDASLHSMGT